MVKDDDNSILIGGKPFMNYVTGVVVQFSNGASDVIVKARGKFISKAVDVAEVARRKFLTEQNVSIKDIKINSDEFDREDGKKVCVSSLEITLSKK
jgi:DNA-binding protein